MDSLTRSSGDLLVARDQTVLVVDNLSPFTGQIVNCLANLGTRTVRKKYSELYRYGEFLTNETRYDKIIISGRRLCSRESNATNSRLLRSCFSHNIPTLGICYGAQIMALTFGGSIKRMDGRASRISTIAISRSNALVPNKRTIDVFESHLYCIARLPKDFYTFASSEFCEYEIIGHRSKILFGTQFHPEKSGTDGLNLLSNFLRL
jgi:GMP synthase (glutamine-hydrolysing)